MTPAATSLPSALHTPCAPCSGASGTPTWNATSSSMPLSSRYRATCASLGNPICGAIDSASPMKARTCRGQSPTALLGAGHSMRECATGCQGNTPRETSTSGATGWSSWSLMELPAAQFLAPCPQGKRTEVTQAACMPQPPPRSHPTPPQACRRPAASAAAWYQRSATAHLCIREPG